MPRRSFSEGGFAAGVGAPSLCSAGIQPSTPDPGNNDFCPQIARIYAEDFNKGNGGNEEAGQDNF
jgi:hypothetical protein